MTHYQFGKDDEARLELASARRILDPVTQKGPSAYSQSRMGVWMERVEARSLLREATSLISKADRLRKRGLSPTISPTRLPRMSKPKRIELAEFLQPASALLTPGL